MLKRHEQPFSVNPKYQSSFIERTDHFVICKVCSDSNFKEKEEIWSGSCYYTVIRYTVHRLNILQVFLN